ncbi:hypothetical protein RHMOL_Rhmol13G0070700 [Rhododendron molle]|uniref:Uncharacterized protein n=4 Tax=Rhododendron molle TaxID=49168 RepID=A0ACC0L5E3_RHOML|nr:hypothetical protein RHMOL_Rhmol13G0070700 [Rhododendron molle]KAI8523402.1 hypothetical protein RHMOL_Rhmol13G0070700 [Rhododendron molle]KAI8523403.1 hypothetical protein RHMOL_Rhmol13G0070700 [Rhododendron molle]KAI8523404.1 hypothetical protein RHMOL_Rhmol13G0070700 [Rhododendron molle]
MADLLLQGCSELIENGEGNLESPQMFRSELGKSVSVKQSSITKALSILGDERDAFADTGYSISTRDGNWQDDSQKNHKEVSMDTSLMISRTKNVQS